MESFRGFKSNEYKEDFHKQEKKINDSVYTNKDLTKLFSQVVCNISQI